MNAQQLKNAILQEAIKGRLVPQDPNDEPASALLARIRKEKEQLVKAGKLKKKDLEVKPISEDEKPFEIPDSWEWVRMQDVIEFVNGRAYKRDELLDKGKYKVLRVGNFFTNESWYYSDLELPDEKYCYKDDLLYAWSASFSPKIWDGDKTIFHYHIWNVKYNKNILFRDYLFYFFLIDKESIKSATTGSTMVHVSMENMKPRLLPLPPLAEQKRIVAKIEELLPKVEEYGKAQEALDKLNAELPDRLKKSVLQEAIEGRLVPQDPTDEPASALLARIRKEKEQLVKAGKLKKKDLEVKPISEDEKPFKIPDSWEWVRMQDVIEFVNGRAYKRDELLDKGKYKVLRVGNFFTNESWYYSDLELPDEKYCYKDDLLYAWSASFSPKIWDGDKTIFHYHIWNVKYNKNILFRDYLFYFFLIDKESIKSATTGSTMVHVSMENMKPRLLPLPPLAEQHRIVEKLEQLLGEIDKLKK